MSANETSEELGTMLSRASHFLRTPLSVLMLELGMVDGLRARQLEEDVAAYAEVMRKSFVLLKLSVGDVGNCSMIDLGQIIESTVEELQPAFHNKRVDVVVVLGRVAHLEGFKQAVVESIRCLLENALADAPDGSRVTIACRSNLTISVEDAGPGVPDAVADRAFDPFTDPLADTESYGLGLTIARAAARLHDGAVEIKRSKALGGARVDLKLGACTPT